MKSRRILLTLGCFLVVLSGVSMVMLHVHTNYAKQKNDEVILVMETIFADPVQNSVDVLWDEEMPSLEIDGEDYIALLKIPAFGVKVPVCASWDKWNIMNHPCRLLGNAYNGTLIIGGSDQNGQFDFFDRVETGMDVHLMDMSGNEFSYDVIRIERSSSASFDRLKDESSDLTLYVRDSRFLEYILIHCEGK